MICSFDKSKNKITRQKYATIVAQQPIWDNALLKHDDKTLCFKAGFIAAYYLFKNFFFLNFNSKGQFKILQEFFSFLKEKYNLIRQYEIVKSALFNKRCNMTC